MNPTDPNQAAMLIPVNEDYYPRIRRLKDEIARTQTTLLTLATQLDRARRAVLAAQAAAPSPVEAARVVRR